MRMILRRRFVLPVLLAAVAAIVGGLFAGLGGPDPTRDTSAGHTGQPIYFRFLPPSKADDADVRLNCGWHKACASEFPDLYPDDTDDDSPLDLGLDFEGGRGDPLYLRGHGHAPGHATQYEPVTVTIYEWPHPVTGKNDTDTPGCLVVEADFKLNSIVNQPSIGRYRLLHAVAASMTSGGTTHGHTYKPHFDSDGAYNQDRIATVAPSTDDPCLGHKDKLDHVHVERDRGLRDALATAAWKENRSRYATERQTEVWDKEPHTRHLAEWAYANNTDSLNWTHQLCIAGSCPIPSLYPTPMLVPAGHDSEESVDGKGGSDDSQADACAEAKKDARSKLPRGTTGITYTPEDCNTLSTTTTGDVEATGTGTSTDSQLVADNRAKRAAKAALPSGATGVTTTVTDRKTEVSGEGRGRRSRPARARPARPTGPRPYPLPGGWRSLTVALARALQRRWRSRPRTCAPSTWPRPRPCEHALSARAIGRKPRPARARPGRPTGPRPYPPPGGWRSSTVALARALQRRWRSRPRTCAPST